MKPANSSATSATSSTVVNSPSTVPSQHLVWMDTCFVDAERPLRRLGVCLSTNGWGRIAALHPIGAHAMRFALPWRWTMALGLGSPCFAVTYPGFERRRLLGMHRTHIDDSVAGTFLVHMRNARLGGKKRAVEMDRKQPLPFGEWKFLDRVDDLDARIGDENVRSLCLRGDHLRDARIHLVLVGHIHRDSPSPGLGLLP